MKFDAERGQVSRALKVLEDSLVRLVDALAHRPAQVQIENASTERAAIRSVCNAYQAIEYSMTDEVGESVTCLGVVGVSSEVLKRAEAVNAAKAAFKEVCAPLQNARIRVPVKGAEETKAIPVIRYVLRTIQRSDLNLLAAYRKIPVLAVAPASVTYTRARTRAVYRKTVAEIAAILDGQEGLRALEDLERLSSLPKGEKHLALVKDHYENVRANIVYRGLDKRGRGRVQMSAELPLMYAVGRNPEKPKVRFPGAEDDDSRPKRVRKSKLQEKAFLSTVGVWRYLSLG
jgi:hypothetical protein